MSRLTSLNLHELINSIDDDVASTNSSPSEESFPTWAGSRAIQPIIEDNNIDVDMSCGLETVEQVYFSGIGRCGIVADKPAGPKTQSPTKGSSSRDTADDGRDIDWDNMITDPTLYAADEEKNLHFMNLGLPIRSRSSTPDLSTFTGSTHTTFATSIHPRLRSAHAYESFPDPMEAKLAEATGTLLDKPKCYSCAVSEAEDIDEVETSISEMRIDDEAVLIAATDTMSLEPPFWASSSQSSSDGEDGGSFANDGWRSHEIRRGWSPERARSVSPRRAWEEDAYRLTDNYRARTREWVKRGGVSGSSSSCGMMKF